MTGVAMARKTFTVRLDEDTYRQIEDIMKAKRWGQQTMGEVIIEHYLNSLKAARQSAVKQQNQTNGK